MFRRRRMERDGQKEKELIQYVYFLKAAAQRANNLPAMRPGAIPKASVAPCAYTLLYDDDTLAHSGPIPALQSEIPRSIL